MYEWNAILKKSGVFFLNGGVLNDPVGSAADGLIALNHRDVHTGLDLFEGLLGAVCTLLQVLVDLLIGGDEVLVLGDLQQGHPGAGVLLSGSVHVGREGLAGLVDLAQVAVQAHPLHLELLLDVLHLVLVGALYQNTGQLTLSGGSISDTIVQEKGAAEKGKLLPTDTGIVVNDFLIANFPAIMDYNFTANVEKDFDHVAEGGMKWTDLIRGFYTDFDPEVERIMADNSGQKAGERILGTDPATGRTVSVRIGRYGPMVQVGTTDDEEKPRFATLRAEMSMSTITLEQALDLFKLPRTLGDYEGKTVTIGVGRFGPYVHHDGKYATLGKEDDPLTVSLERAIALICAKREAEAKSHLKAFAEEPGMEVRTGRYGPYIAFEGKNYKIPKAKADEAANLTLDECRAIIEAEKNKAAKPARRRTAAKKA